MEEGKGIEKWYNYIVTSKINLGKVDHEMFLNNAIVSVFLNAYLEVFFIVVVSAPKALFFFTEYIQYML